MNNVDGEGNVSELPRPRQDDDDDEDIDSLTGSCTLINVSCRWYMVNGYGSY